MSVESGCEPEQILRLHDEHVVVQRRRVERDTVRVSTRVETREEVVETDLALEQVVVRRVAVDRVVDAVPEPRQEGDTLIIPVVREELVIRRQLVLTEEVHVQRRTIPQTHKETITLRREVAVIDRLPAPDPVIKPGGGS